jgi:YD repeat-containing protein
VTEKRVDFTYNVLGQYDTVTRYADAAGTSLVASTAYGYDPLGRLASLLDAQGQTALAAYGQTTDVASQLVGESDAEGYTAYRYDATGQLTSADHQTQADESYAYDAAGNRSGTTVAAGTASFGAPASTRSRPTRLTLFG